MSERRMGFRFHAQHHGPPTSHTGPPKPVLEPIKQTTSLEQSATYDGGRRFGFPSSMFQRGGRNNAWPDPTGGWVRTTGSTLPPDEPLDPVVRNYNASAANIGRSSAVIAGDGNWGSGQAFPGMKKATGLQTIDSSEAAKKYGGRFMF